MNAKACGAFLLLTALASCGCASYQAQPSDYRTVQANPNRDTERASEEFHRALELAEEEDWVAAEQALQQALIADVTYGPAHNNLGKLYYHQKKFYLAAWEFEYASRLMPRRAEPLNNLGLVYEAVDRLDQAITFFEMAYALEPEDPEVIGNLARCRLRRGDADGELRRLLGELVYYDTRPDWVGWAKEQIALGKLPDDSPSFEILDLPHDAPAIEMLGPPVPSDLPNWQEESNAPTLRFVP